jgi:hypothetical protein
MQLVEARMSAHMLNEHLVTLMLHAALDGQLGLVMAASTAGPAATREVMCSD